MKAAILIIALALQAATTAPVLAQGCTNPCPEGQIYSAEEGRCVIMTPMV